MQPKHRNSEGSARCILVFIVTLFGVIAAMTAEFLGIGDMHIVFPQTAIAAGVLACTG